jgi:hypothetical protein
MQMTRKFVISDFRRDVVEICALLVCYAALSGSSVTEVLAQPIGQEVQEDSLGTS